MFLSSYQGMKFAGIMKKRESLMESIKERTRFMITNKEKRLKKN